MQINNSSVIGSKTEHSLDIDLSTTICSWDIGTKNLAYCVMQKNKNIKIIKWGIINLLETKYDNKKCDKCNKKIKYCYNFLNDIYYRCSNHKNIDNLCDQLMIENINVIGCQEKSCDSHTRHSRKFMYVNKNLNNFYYCSKHKNDECVAAVCEYILQKKKHDMWKNSKI